MESPAAQNCAHPGLLDVVRGIQARLEDWGMSPTEVSAILTEELKKAKLADVSEHLYNPQKIGEVPIKQKCDDTQVQEKEKEVDEGCQDTDEFDIIENHQMAKFDMLMGVFIFSNVFCLSFQTDYQARYPGSAVPPWTVQAEWAFTGIFLLEIFARLGMEKGDFFVGSNRFWNAFDAFSVFASLADLVLGALKLTEKNKIIGLIRLTKVLKLIRVLRFLTDLRKMVLGIIGTLVCLFWAMVLLSGIILVFSLVFTDVATGLIEEGTMDIDMREFYGSVPTTGYSLFKAVSGGIDWGDLADPLLEAHYMYFTIFGAYILLVVYCVLNVVTALFVDRASELLNEDMRRYDKFRGKLRQFVARVDESSDGVVSLEEFESFCQDHKMGKFWRDLKIDTEVIKPRKLFNTLNAESKKNFTVDDMLLGLLKCSGTAKSVDMISLTNDVRLLEKKFDSMTSSFHEKLDTILKQSRTPRSSRNISRGAQSRDNMSCYNLLPEDANQETDSPPAFKLHKVRWAKSAHRWARENEGRDTAHEEVTSPTANLRQDSVPAEGHRDTVHEADTSPRANLRSGQHLARDGAPKAKRASRLQPQQGTGHNLPTE